MLNSKGRPKTRELGAKCPKLNGKKPHGTWWYYIKLPPGPDGKPNRDRRGGFENKDKAEDALKKVIARLDRSEEVDHRTTVAQFLTQWLASKKKLEESTANSYEGHIRNYLEPYLGAIVLEDLRPQHIRDMFDAIGERNLVIAYELGVIAKARQEYAEWKAQYGRKPGRPRADAPPPPVPAPEIPKRKKHRQMRIVAAATMHRILATLRSALTRAVEELRIPKNWASLVELPSGKRPKALLWTPERVAEWQRTGIKPSKVMVWTPPQAGAFLDGIAEDWLRAYWHLLIFRGLRRGEGCGLRWSAVDLDSGVIHVTWQIVTVKYKKKGKAPKQDSVRTIALDSHTLAELREHKVRMDEARRLAAEAGTPWPDHDFVFVREDGTEIHPDYLTDRFDLLEQRLGLPPITLHGTRHLAAVLALAGGADLKVVQDLLGHSSITITADTYTSVLPELDRSSAEAAVALVPMASSMVRGPASPRPAFVVDYYGRFQVAFSQQETAQQFVEQCNTDDTAITGHPTTEPLTVPAEPELFTGKVWEAMPHRQVVHTVWAVINSRTGRVDDEDPMSSVPYWEFDGEFFTYRQAQWTMERRPGPRGWIEISAWGTEPEAVKEAFKIAHAKAQAQADGTERWTDRDSGTVD
ncbi:site-specific integrase [Kitasatospora sp. RB6PN24]|uniref:site-specific integrase n=1 Tax=Kitasatospora humi TaxID=2893891 RepID=UPI001E3DF6A6|nr:site-specific integrase [Kitasatospora humi]MCC9309296.1 site-specific integrase [Kitasatospora humi]